MIFIVYFNRNSQEWETYYSLKCPREGASSVILPCNGNMMVAGGNSMVETEILERYHVSKDLNFTKALLYEISLGAYENKAI